MGPILNSAVSPNKSISITNTEINQRLDLSMAHMGSFNGLVPSLAEVTLEEIQQIKDGDKSKLNLTVGKLGRLIEQISKLDPTWFQEDLVATLKYLRETLNLLVVNALHAIP